MKIIADLIRAGTDPELVARVAATILEAANGSSELRDDADSLRRARNQRYYQSRRLKSSEKRLNSDDQDDSKTIKTPLKTVSDDIKTVEPVKTVDASERRLNSDAASHVRDEEINPLDSKNQDIKNSPSESKKKSAGSDRGTRIAEDWQPLPGTFDQAWTELHLTRQAVLTELLAFRDYWLSMPGARGRKVFWDRTFINRLRDKYARHRPARDGPPASQRRNPIFATVEKNIQRRQQHEPNGHVSEANGSVSDPDIHSPLGDDIQAPGSAPTGRPRGILSRSFFGRDS